MTYTHSQVVEFLKALAYHSRPDVHPRRPFESKEPLPRIFISGSYKQLDMMREIADLVERAGFVSWFADREIRPGDPLVDTISQAIADSDCMIVILSEDSAKSSWVEFEAERAYAAQKIILPIRIGDAPVPKFLLNFAYLQVMNAELKETDKDLIIQGVQRILARQKM